MPDMFSNVWESSAPLALLDLIIVFYLVYVLLLLVRERECLRRFTFGLPLR